MKIHKPFLNILREAKAGTVSGMLSELGLIRSHEHDIVLNDETARALEEVAYTIDFLEKNKLADSRFESGAVPRVTVPGASTHGASQAEYLNSLLERSYQKHLIVTPEFTLFAERGYQLPSVRNREYRILLLFVKTIVFAVITALLNRLLL